MAVIVLGIVVAVVAVVALRSPSNRSAPGTSSSAPAGPRSGSAQRLPTSARTSSSTVGSVVSSAVPPSSPSGSRTATDSTSGVKAVPLVVLNNTTVAGLAGQAAARFQAGGWRVTSSGNLQNTIISTCAYYDPAVAGAQAAAQALQKQFPTIKRVEPKFPELPAGPIVVVLTPDYSSN